MITNHMKGIILCVFFLSFVAFFPLEVKGVENTNQALINDKTLKLSIEEGMLMVLEKNLDIAIERIAPMVEEARIYKEKGAFDPVFSGSFQRDDASAPLGSRSSVAAGGRNIVESEVYSLNTGISGKLSPGTGYSMEFEDTWTGNTFNRFRTEYDSFAGIKITQPLLKGAGFDVNRFNIRIAQKNKDISVNELKKRVIDTLAEFKKAYWDMVLAIEDVKVKEESLKLAEYLLGLSRKRLKAEVVSPLEVTQAEAGVASRREAVIMARKNVNEKENALKRLITNDIYALRDINIVPTDTPVAAPVILDPEESIRHGLANRLDYKEMKIEVEKKDITVQYARNQEFPNIDLEASYGFNGLADSFGDSLREMDDNPQWTLGVVMKFPIGNRAAGGDLRVARLEAKKSLLNLKKLEQEILVEIDNAIRELDMNKQRIEVTKVSTKLARESLRAEEIKLKAGLSTSHNVLEFQEDLAEARSREISAVIDYNKSQVELSRVKGMLLEEEGISFSENMTTEFGRQGYK